MNTTIEFKNVSFGYSQDAPLVLNDISLTLEKGKSYAFVGPTGQGKSTTASLMARLYEPTSGQILFQGKDLKDWDSQALYSEIGFILQEPYLFSGTVLDNIVYGNPDFKQYSMVFDESGTTEEAEYESFLVILKNKGLEKLIDLFPDGLKTVVTNNSENISLGQKQIINFLRVIIREPSFLILDEATANLDTITEKLLQQILDSLPKTVTKMIIAHRLNTIKDVDQVFLVGGGKVEVREKG
jgi:ATP-binding cassette, subfamily B, bacterial